ncbi:MAG TPA: CrcB family protein [Acidimicrobiales bacterium]|nr:CrcB family protein [Acidimicrobiales bacterium]
MQPRTTALLVGVGGAAGASVRWAVLESVEPSTSFPVATFVVNVIGCLLLGLVFVRSGESVQAAVGTGLCGGLTTFSTFAVEVVRLAENDEAAMALSYLVASVLFGLGALIGAQHFARSRA